MRLYCANCCTNCFLLFSEYCLSCIGTGETDDQAELAHNLMYSGGTVTDFPLQTYKSFK